MKTYVVDIDGTICRTKGGDYKNAKPIKARIRAINVLWIRGHKIIYFTSRGYLTKKNWYKLTKQQLSDWNARYDELKMGKPYGDYYIDDKSITFKQL